MDLEISGASNATIKGAFGTCTISERIGNSYGIEGSDVPGARGPTGTIHCG